MAGIATIVGASLIAVGAGMALAAFRKPMAHMASGHLVGLTMGRRASYPGVRAFVPRPNGAGFAAEPIIVIPEFSLGHVYSQGVPASAQGERLVAFQRP